ncbi:MAG: trimeric intracellular cation channel family protein [Atopobiaceae bacterium]|jgi:uncharacterized membrane protein YeiH
MLSYLFSHTGASDMSLSIPLWLELAAVVVGSISGILAAQRRELDLMGTLSLSIIGGLGGGLIRDIIMQQGVYMLDSVYAIPTTVIAGFVGFYFPGILQRHPHILEWVDMISVALFVAVGTNKAVLYDVNFAGSVLMGVITGVGGGILRDISLGEVPRVFRQGNFYAWCAVAGALVYYICIKPADMTQVLAVVLCTLATVGLRRISLHYNVQSKIGVDLEPRIGSAYHSIRDKIPKEYPAGVTYSKSEHDTKDDHTYDHTQRS